MWLSITFFGYLALTPFSTGIDGLFTKDIGGGLCV